MDPTANVIAPRAPRHRADPRAPRWWTVRAVLGVAVVLVPRVVALIVLGAGALAAVRGLRWPWSWDWV